MPLSSLCIWLGLNMATLFQFPIQITGVIVATYGVILTGVYCLVEPEYDQ